MEEGERGKGLGREGGWKMRKRKGGMKKEKGEEEG